jgi:hypothetical protein
MVHDGNGIIQNGLQEHALQAFCSWMGVPPGGSPGDPQFSLALDRGLIRLRAYGHNAAVFADPPKSALSTPRKYEPTEVLENDAGSEPAIKQIIQKMVWDRFVAFGCYKLPSRIHRLEGRFWLLSQWRRCMDILQWASCGPLGAGVETVQPRESPRLPPLHLEEAPGSRHPTDASFVKSGSG